MRTYILKFAIPVKRELCWDYSKYADAKNAARLKMMEKVAATINKEKFPYIHYSEFEFTNSLQPAFYWKVSLDSHRHYYDIQDVFDKKELLAIYDLSPFSPLIKIADQIHELICHWNHADGCSWHYESWEKPGSARQEYLEWADRLVKKFGKEDEVLRFFEIMAKTKEASEETRL